MVRSPPSDAFATRSSKRVSLVSDRGWEARFLPSTHIADSTRDPTEHVSDHADDQQSNGGVKADQEECDRDEGEPQQDVADEGRKAVPKHGRDEHGVSSMSLKCNSSP